MGRELGSEIGSAEWDVFPPAGEFTATQKLVVQR